MTSQIRAQERIKKNNQNHMVGIDHKDCHPCYFATDGADGS